MKDIRFAICINNAGYPASLELMKIYKRVDDGVATSDGMRIIDESGEDAVFPADCFVPLELSAESAEHALDASQASERNYSLPF